MVGQNIMYRRDQIDYQMRFRDVAEASRGEASAHKCRVRMTCQENQLGTGPSLVEFTCGFDSREDRQPDELL
jgi:hypothetical protein